MPVLPPSRWYPMEPSLSPSAPMWVLLIEDEARLADSVRRGLEEEGYRVVLVNSNPATIMTDPGMADATYVEPITPEIVTKIIEKERPDAVLPTMGGQTALNCALSLQKMGVLEKYGVTMIGADAEAIDKAEDRQKFRDAMDSIGDNGVFIPFLVDVAQH